jgi:putative transposase
MSSRSGSAPTASSSRSGSGRLDGEPHAGRALLADLVERGLDPGQAIPFVIDGGKALRRAIKDVFGEHALVHRCHRDRERNVTDLLPERDRDELRAQMRVAWALTDPELARQRLELLASQVPGRGVRGWR